MYVKYTTRNNDCVILEAKINEELFFSFIKTIYIELLLKTIFWITNNEEVYIQKNNILKRNSFNFIKHEIKAFSVPIAYNSLFHKG